MKCGFLREEHPNRTRGTTAVLLVITVPVMIGMAALAVDVGYMINLATEAQNTADAGALAGANALRNTDFEFAYVRTHEIIAHNQQRQGFTAPSDQIVQFGWWDTTTQTFTEMAAENLASANAARVVAVRNDTPLFFAALWGVTSTDMSREAVAMIQPSCGGIWGIDSVKVPGTVDIDSFDSTVEAYSAGTAASNGDLCSNGTITVGGAANVNGDIRTSEVVLNGGAMNITGVVEDALVFATPKPVDFGDALTNNDNATIGLTDAGTNPLDNSQVSNPGFYDLKLTDAENLTLAPGTYIFDDIEMSGSSTLTLTGPTTIYLDDDLQMSGTTVLNTTQNSADLMIICDGDVDGSTIQINGSAEFYGSIYAPESAIQLTGNADYYGAIVGGTVDFGGNFYFHLDESLPLAQKMKGNVFLVW